MADALDVLGPGGGDALHRLQRDLDVVAADPGFLRLAVTQDRPPGHDIDATRWALEQARLATQESERQMMEMSRHLDAIDRQSAAVLASHRRMLAERGARTDGARGTGVDD